MNRQYYGENESFSANTELSYLSDKTCFKNEFCHIFNLVVLGIFVSFYCFIILILFMCQLYKVECWFIGGDNLTDTSYSSRCHHHFRQALLQYNRLTQVYLENGR